MLNLVNDFSHGPAAILLAEEKPFGAELAPERTAARRDDDKGSERPVAAQVQQVITGQRQASQAHRFLCLVSRLEAAAPGVL